VTIGFYIRAANQQLFLTVKKNFVLITGASHGIGRAMAFEFARMGYPIVMVALLDDLLEATAAEIKQQYPVHVLTHGTDLTSAGAIEQLKVWYDGLGISLAGLVNNAGFGTSGLFEYGSLPRFNMMIDLNNKAMVNMIYHFMPELRKASSAFIMNMSSMEATLPLPYKAVYTGTKSFVYAFSLALREELREFGITVSVLCPGPTITNEEGLLRIQTQGKSAKLMVKMPEEVARVAIKNVLRGKSVIIPGKVPWTFMKLGKLAPTNFKMRLLQRMFRAYRDLPGVVSK
jgi:short-subunit dehydrogenase